ncbi:hypothetical protein LINGRAHAP2_LOCUS6575 [Linum grandiflorum]
MKRKGDSDLGCIIRDWNGEVVYAAAKTETVKWNTDTAEGRAILFGLQKAIAMRLTPLIVESDCKKLIDMLKKKEVCRYEIGSICSDIVELGMQSDVCDWIFVAREANNAAHGLAHVFPPHPGEGTIVHLYS